MKNVLFMMSAFLSLGVFCACNSDDGISTRSSDDNVTLIPIEEGDGFAAISDFFKMTFATEEIKEKAFDFKNNLCNDGINACILINNEEEFKSVYMGDSPLPAIDFSKYSLIIGKVYISAGTFIDNMSIRQVNNTKSILTLNYMIDTKGCYVGIVYYEYYWSLFPKFNASEVVVEKTGSTEGTVLASLRFFQSIRFLKAA